MKLFHFAAVTGKTKWQGQIVAIQRSDTGTQELRQGVIGRPGDGTRAGGLVKDVRIHILCVWKHSVSESQLLRWV